MARALPALTAAIAVFGFTRGAGAQAPGPEGTESDDAGSIELAKSAIADVVLHKYQPLPTVGIADDIARAALFLAGDASRLVSGIDLVVDGGISAGWPIAAVREDRARFLKHFNRTR